ncbi:ABC transporter ATP-binding protein [Helicobacter sp. 12S02232-10]|uniref:ABC transporter ATP-binding protein n=1 Tax=Helicobacter sp. 12S02232-10 TaxID=1476197 RepID=UPI000BA7309F|nr:ABC transporter ATP-binding protein [Helicobacter sp. 12S02232-10]PAF49946.1 ABC transporter ATP-binding protein [Helicobacter sp. 12S02232-10]
MEPSQAHLVSINHLSKSYGNSLVLDDITLSLPNKKIIGLLGPNGAGKTTFIKILANLLTQYQGEILINGHKPGIESKKVTSYLPDVNFLDESWNALKAVDFYEDFFKDFEKQKALFLLEKFQIPLQKRFKILSKGTKEKLQLILTLSREAKLYLFDEPIAGVDPLARQEVFDLILQNRALDSSVIISTHLVYDVEKYLDLCIFIKNGKIIRFGNVEDVRNGFGNLENAFKEIFK